MSVRETIILNRTDLRYLLIDSLRLYSDHVVFIGGNNPYRFVSNKKEFYVLIKNVHESGDGRTNQDECRIQVSKSVNFNEALNSKKDVVVLGYFADERVFTAWNPFLIRERFNSRDTISLYSRFSKQRKLQALKLLFMKIQMAKLSSAFSQNILAFIWRILSRCIFCPRMSYEKSHCVLM